MVRKIIVRGMNVGGIPVGAASRRDYFKLCKTDKVAPRQLLLRCSTSCIPAVVRIRPRHTILPEHNRCETQLPQFKFPHSHIPTFPIPTSDLEDLAYE